MRARGYVLIETVVAMSVLGVSLIAINGAMRQATVTKALARDFTHARFVLEQVVGTAELTQIIDPVRRSGRFPGELSHYAWEYEITLIELPAPPLMWEPENRQQQELIEALMDEEGVIQLPVDKIPHVRARVSWTRAGREYEEVVETLLDPNRLRQETMVEFGP